MTDEVTNLPRMGRPRRLAVDRLVRRTAAAPSETWDALPARGDKVSDGYRHRNQRECEEKGRWLDERRTEEGATQEETTHQQVCGLLECWLQLGQTLPRNTIPNTVIRVYQSLSSSVLGSTHLALMGKISSLNLPAFGQQRPFGRSGRRRRLGWHR